MQPKIYHFPRIIIIFLCVRFQCIDHEIGWHHIYCVIVYLSQTCKRNKAVFKHKTVKRNTLKFSKIMYSSSHKYLYLNIYDRSSINVNDFQLMWMNLYVKWNTGYTLHVYHLITFENILKCWFWDGSMVLALKIFRLF